jgi:hypothetical protein
MSVYPEEKRSVSYEATGAEGRKENKGKGREGVKKNIQATRPGKNGFLLRSA